MEEPKHAYIIRQAIIDLTSLNYFPSHSSVMNAINKLRSAGLADNWVENPYYWFKAKRGEPYSLTRQGLSRVLEELEVYEKLLKTTEFWQVRNRAYGPQRDLFRELFNEGRSL